LFKLFAAASSIGRSFLVFSYSWFSFARQSCAVWAELIFLSWAFFLTLRVAKSDPWVPLHFYIHSKGFVLNYCIVFADKFLLFFVEVLDQWRVFNILSSFLRHISNSYCSLLHELVLLHLFDRGFSESLSSPPDARNIWHQFRRDFCNFSSPTVLMLETARFYQLLLFPFQNCEGFIPMETGCQMEVGAWQVSIDCTDTSTCWTFLCYLSVTCWKHVPCKK